MFVESRGAQLFATSFGAGPQTVLGLGGWIGSGELWLPVLSLLSSERRTVTFDQRGSGTSHVKDARSITGEAWVDDVFVVMDALGIDRCLMMSDSSGCFPAVLAAAKHPERFEGLVIIGGALRMPKDLERQLFAIGLRLASRPLLKEFARRCLPEDDTGLVRRWLWDICVRAAPRDAARLIEVIDGFDLTDVCASITIPTLIVHGNRDQIVPLSGGEELAALIPGSEIVVMDGLGHVPMMSRPEAVASIVEEWIAERGIASRGALT